MKRYAPLLCAAVVCVAASPALAQDAGYAPDTVSTAQNTSYEAPAHVALVEGAASLERDGRTDSAPASMPLLTGDRVRTHVGRVEVLFTDGSTLHLDHHTTVDFQSDEVVRLLSGRVRLNIPGTARDVAYRIDAPGAWVQIDYPGEYRIALLRDDDVELAVLRGAASLVNEDGRTPLRAGERAFARAGAAPSLAYVFNSAAWDAFDRWSEGRRDERLGVSAQYLPDQVRPYASTFDRYGSWRHEPAYGYVWYPTVYSEWRPYYRGRWTSLRPYGWTWIGHDPWAWPTHHYGRWGFSAGLWFWIPGRHWGPAWVSWASAPGYVSWCPLGWNNRPVVQFVNIYRGRHHDPWRAWTVVPRRHFGRSVVHANVVHASAIQPRVRQAFVVRDRAPAITGYAVPRAAAPIRRAGTGIVGRAVPRGTAPASSDIRTGADAAAGRSVAPFRGERPGVSTTGPGFPARSRAPRAPSTVAAPRASGETGTRAAPSTDRSGVARPRRGAVPYDPGPSRRAVPRDRPADRRERGVPAGRNPASRAPHDGEARRPAAPRPEAARPRRGDDPAYAPRPAPHQPSGYPVPQRSAAPRESTPAPSARPERPRAVPRGRDAARPSYQPAPAPPPTYAPRPVPRREAPPVSQPAPAPRGERSAPPPTYAPRAVPRGGGPPPGAHRPAPAPRIERSAPPPAPAAAPPPSEGRPAARPRGGDGAKGGAARRPRGN